MITKSKIWKIFSTKIIVVFDDSETWQLLSGDNIQIIQVSDKQSNRLEEGEYPKNIKFKPFSN